MSWTELYETFQTLLLTNTPCVMVTLVDAIGSIPQEIGAKLLVFQNNDGFDSIGFQGTIGGGKLEKKALSVAQEMLLSTSEASDRIKKKEIKKHQLHRWHLDLDVGMTCGGTVTLFFEAFHTQPFYWVVFGAGHISQALIPQLLRLDSQVLCIDSRPEWLEKLPKSSKLKICHAEPMADQVRLIPPNAFVVLMTMGHQSDVPILLEILKTQETGQLPLSYLGVIGSKAKAQRLKKAVREAGLPPEAETSFYCPIGLSLGNNHPQEIAISLLAQCLQIRDRLENQFN
ncbi:MAG: XdhC family protein [Cyanobacteria bacterium]|nr:XdhC family protein [Cyanobacteriota bacterium]